MPPDRLDLPLAALDRWELYSYKHNLDVFAHNLELSRTKHYTIPFPRFSPRSNIRPITKASLNTALYDLFPKDDMPCLGCRNEDGVSCGCLPRFLRQWRGGRVGADDSAGGRAPQETTTTAGGRGTYPHFLFALRTSFTIAPRTPAQDRPNMRQFVVHLADQHNRQEPPPQFQFSAFGRPQSMDCWRFGLPNDTRPHDPVPHMGAPREYYFLIFILTIPGDDVDKPS